MFTVYKLRLWGVLSHEECNGQLVWLAKLCQYKTIYIVYIQFVFKVSVKGTLLGEKLHSTHAEQERWQLVCPVTLNYEGELIHIPNASRICSKTSSHEIQKEIEWRQLMFLTLVFLIFRLQINIAILSLGDLWNMLTMLFKNASRWFSYKTKYVHSSVGVVCCHNPHIPCKYPVL